jgi:hypothetical protein
MSLISDTEEHRLIRESVGAIAAGGGVYSEHSAEKQVCPNYSNYSASLLDY